MTDIIRFHDKHAFVWDDYVRRSPAGTFYHLSGWKRAVEKTFGFHAEYLMANDESGELCGILPLFMLKDVIGRKYLISGPSSNYAGVCASDVDSEMKLLEEAKKIASQNCVQYMELRQRESAPYDLPTKNDFVTMVLKLESEEDLIWKNSLKSVTRNRIRKAYHQDLTVDSGVRYLDDFYAVYSTNMRDLGTPVYPKALFSNIVEELDDLVTLIAVKYQDRVIGAMFSVFFKNVFCDPWVSTYRRYSNLCPGDFLYWESIKFALAKNAEYFDFGRSTVDSGTFNFKKKWGAEPVQLHYQYYLNKARKIPEVSAHDNKYQNVIDLWKKLPLAVANRLGPRLAKYLPEL